MCIVSFYKEEDQILLTHSRDESIYRTTSTNIEKREWYGKTYYSPVDHEKNGSWIFYSEQYLACILNGGKIKPKELKPSYRRSRGLVLLDILKYNEVEEFIENEDLTGIAPFTILIHDRKNNKTFLLFWDEIQLDINDLSDETFIFRCSSTLYSFEKMKELENIFPKFNLSSPEIIFKLHEQIKMKPGDVALEKATTSITQIFANSSSINMKYCPFF